jgi:hypothetical protein
MNRNDGQSDGPSSGAEEGWVSLIPERRAWLRATVSTFPWVGSALDHLIFDKADSVRLRNIEYALNEIGQKLSTIRVECIDRKWFESEEALAMFRELSDRIQFEPDKSKVRVLAQIVAVSGTHEFSKDENKLSLLYLLSRLSYVQMKLLKIISQLRASERSASGTGITFTITAIFSDAIVAAVGKSPEGQFWTDHLDLAVEMDILESINFVRRITWQGDAVPYLLTKLGRKAIDYLQNTDT